LFVLFREVAKREKEREREDREKKRKERERAEKRERELKRKRLDREREVAESERVQIFSRQEKFCKRRLCRIACFLHPCVRRRRQRGIIGCKLFYNLPQQSSHAHAVYAEGTESWKNTIRRADWYYFSHERFFSWRAFEFCLCHTILPYYFDQDLGFTLAAGRGYLKNGNYIV
jgi:hypothetical protein